MSGCNLTQYSTLSNLGKGPDSYRPFMTVSVDCCMTSRSFWQASPSADVYARNKPILSFWQEKLGGLTEPKISSFVK